MDDGVEELAERLRVLEAHAVEIARERNEVLCEYVDRVGGVTEAATRLGMDARTLSARVLPGELALVVFRGRNAGGVDPTTGRSYGETDPAHQRDADRGYWQIASTRRKQIRLLVVVVNSEVARVWEVDPTGSWESDPAGSDKVALPLREEPLTAEQLRHRYGTGFALVPGGFRPGRRGVLREYVRLRRRVGPAAHQPERRPL